MYFRPGLLIIFIAAVASGSDVGFFKTRLDHSNPNSEIINLEYYYNYEFYKDGPAILLIGGETPISLSWVEVDETFPVVVAEGTKAAVFALAHRCYSDFQNNEQWLQPSNLQYCTSEQAILDFVNFIKHISQILRPGTRWIVVGCSYPGRLAIELRAKYPDLVYGAWVSSAPVMAKYNFSEYYHAVRSALLLNCEKAVSHFVNHKYVFKKYLRGLSSKCLALFDNGIVMKAWQSVQDGYYSDEYNNSITDFCKEHHLYNCAGSRSISVGNRMLDSDTAFAIWDFQTCHEFGWFLTELQHQKCYKYSYWQPEILENIIEQKNYEMYKMLKSVSRVLLVYGTLDPWTQSGPSKSYDGVTRISVPGGFHCHDWKIAESEIEKYVVQDAQVKIIMTIREWLKQMN